ncbi:MAG: citrate synthase [Deltaproteobacteria bacterium]|nr:citrate synthase [Deltaproteobacteria bacterium]
MTEKAKLIYQGKEIELDVIEGSEQEKGLDIQKLRSATGLVTLDPAFMNTASTTSSITYIDGEKGILRYRGYPIEQLAEKSTFVETSYLLIHGELPNSSQLDAFKARLSRHTMIHEDMKHFFHGYPATAHPMAILSAMVCSLSSFYPDLLDINTEESRNETFPRLLSKMRTIAAFSYRKSIGAPFLYAPKDMGYAAKFLYMMNANPTEPYDVDPEFESALNLLLILHADHEQNCSTSTVRMVGSSEANLFAVISAGILALWGPLHGGANQKVVEMLSQIHHEGGDVAKYVERAKRKEPGTRLFGFGHRVYKNYDPRAKILRESSARVLARLNKRDPLLDIARNLEEVALSDPYFIERKLYPNVDFYSGIIYRALGIPTNMFTVMFALGRLPGWIAQWKEMIEDPNRKIGRPRQIYTGAPTRDYVPVVDRT